MMKVCYINLANQINRKLEIEKNFSKLNKNDWVVKRFEAIDANSNEIINLKGKITNTNKACNLSHILCLKDNQNSSEPFLTIEDDTVIGQQTYNNLRNFLHQFKQDNVAWDIFFTDIIIPDVHNMLDLIKLRYELSKKKEFITIDLSRINFAGLSSYVINPKSYKKILDLINDNNEIMNLPLDLYIRKLIHQKKINGFAIFPFITTVSKNSFNSQIQLKENELTDHAWNLFRILICNESEFYEQEISQILEQFNLITNNTYFKKFNPIINYLISDQLKIK